MTPLSSCPHSQLWSRRTPPRIPESPGRTTGLQVWGASVGWGGLCSPSCPVPDLPSWPRGSRQGGGDTAWQNFAHEDLCLLRSWDAGGWWGLPKAASGSFSSGSGEASMLASLRLWVCQQSWDGPAPSCSAPGGPPVPALPEGSQAPTVGLSGLRAVAQSGSPALTTLPHLCLGKTWAPSGAQMPLLP